MSPDMKDEKIIHLNIPEKDYGKLAIMAARAKMPIDSYAVQESLPTTSTTSEKP